MFATHDQVRAFLLFVLSVSRNSSRGAVNQHREGILSWCRSFVEVTKVVFLSIPLFLTHLSPEDASFRNWHLHVS
ncbi:hypothetical protein BJ741DRAFT_604624 [Chytriomyces cf. hyalinus JEL632]|nr:hypothetical protein BJ741DRAFT_604624 [Chytriomyces cf. hyalinus JEL632]